MEHRKYFNIDDAGIKKLKNIEKMLEDIKFVGSGNRKVLTYDFARPMSMPIGMKKELNGTYSLPNTDKLYPNVYPAIRDFINDYAPDFKFNAGYINKNVQMIPHKDKNNVDKSIIFCVGDYEGGELTIEGDKYDIKYKLLQFDGKNEEHWVEYFKGVRYSVILYEI
jgi:hypothetical protein